MVGRERRKSRAIEAGDEVRDGITALAPGSTGGVGETLPGGDGKQGFGTRDEGGRFGTGTTEAFQCGAFLSSQRTQRVVLGAGHRAGSS
jgi:hypothetical protein